MKKFLMTCAAIIGVSMAFAATSFAATYDLTAGTVSMDATKLADLADQQLTVIVVEANEDGNFPEEITEGDILYINQEAKGEANFQNMKLLADSLAENKKYYIAVGGEDLSDGIILDLVDTTPVVEPPVEPEEPEPTVVYGDVFSDGKVNAKDKAYLAKYIAKWDGFDETTCDLEAADVTDDGKVNAKDKATLAKHIAKWEGFETLPVK